MSRGAIVLCGGRSTRMGRDKASLPFGDEALLQRVVRLVSAVVEDVVVVSRPDQELPPLPPHVRVVHDEVLDQGPLGGIGPGLKATRTDAAYVTACDVPFLRQPVVELMFERLGAHQVAVPEAAGFVHPMAAVYRPDVLPVLERLFAAGKRRPVELFAEVDTVTVPEADLRALDPELATLANLNTPEAYEAALAHLREEKGTTVRVELYEMARRLAGVAAMEVEATTLGEALDAVRRRHPALEPDVIEGNRLAHHWRASLNGTRWIEASDTPLRPGDAVLLISALAGG